MLFSFIFLLFFSRMASKVRYLLLEHFLLCSAFNSNKANFQLMNKRTHRLKLLFYYFALLSQKSYKHFKLIKNESRLKRSDKARKLRKFKNPLNDYCVLRKPSHLQNFKKDKINVFRRLYPYFVSYWLLSLLLQVNKVVSIFVETQSVNSKTDHFALAQARS